MLRAQWQSLTVKEHIQKDQDQETQTEQLSSISYEELVERAHSSVFKEEKLRLSDISSDDIHILFDNRQRQLSAQAIWEISIPYIADDKLLWKQRLSLSHSINQSRSHSSRLTEQSEETNQEANTSADKLLRLLNFSDSSLIHKSESGTQSMRL